MLSLTKIAILSTERTKGTNHNESESMSQAMLRMIEMDFKLSKEESGGGTVKMR